MLYDIAGNRDQGSGITPHLVRESQSCGPGHRINLGVDVRPGDARQAEREACSEGIPSSEHACACSREGSRRKKINPYIHMHRYVKKKATKTHATCTRIRECSPCYFLPPLLGSAHAVRGDLFRQAVLLKKTCADFRARGRLTRRSCTRPCCFDLRDVCTVL